MWANVLDTLGAAIVRMTPETPPALWLPYAGYAATAIAALVIGWAIVRVTGSWLAAAGMAIAGALTPRVPGLEYGPLVISLMLIGVFLTGNGRVRANTTLAVMILAIATDSVWLISWMFAGFGLALVGDYVATTRGTTSPGLRFAAIVLLTVIAVTARLPAAATSIAPAPKPLGHDRATLKSMRALLSNIPSGSALVAEERAADLIVRAMAGDFERAHVQLTKVRNNASEIRETLKTKRVFALPFAQHDLSLQGFEIFDGLRVADRGLAEVRIGGECVVATHQWQDAPQLAGRTSLAYVATAEDQRDPVVLLLSGREEFIHVNPTGWEPRTLRGFSPKSFDLHSNEGVHEFAAASDGDPLSHSKATSNMLTRVAMWRMPDAPRIMRIDLDQAAPQVVVYLSAEAKGSVSVCPVFPAPVFPIR